MNSVETKRKVDFHDTGPPESLDGNRRPKKLLHLLKRVGNVTHRLLSPRLTMIDLKTAMSVTELQKHIVDNFDFPEGKIEIDGVPMIVKDPKIHERRHANNKGSAAE